MIFKNFLSVLEYVTVAVIYYKAAPPPRSVSN